MPNIDDIREGERYGFVAYFHHVGWECISLGVSIDVWSPNIEVHLPGGFIRVGWMLHKPNHKRYWTTGYGA